MSLVHFLILIIHWHPLCACDESVFIFNELEQCLLPSAKESHLQVVINLCSLSNIELLRLLSINHAAHPTGKSHQRGLWLQAMIGGSCITHDILQEILLFKNTVELWCCRIRFHCNSLMKPLHELVKHSKADWWQLLITIIKDFVTITLKGIWTSEKLYVSDTTKSDHLWAESTVRQRFIIRNLNLIHSEFELVKEKNMLHYFLKRHWQLFLFWENSEVK